MPVQEFLELFNGWVSRTPEVLGHAVQDGAIFLSFDGQDGSCVMTAYFEAHSPAGSAEAEASFDSWEELAEVFKGGAEPRWRLEEAEAWRCA